jgi:hypothetical protein
VTTDSHLFNIGGVAAVRAAAAQPSDALVPEHAPTHGGAPLSRSFVSQVVHGDRLWVGNNNGDSTNCAEGYDLTGTNGTALQPVWPVNTFKDIAFSISSTGMVSALTLDGVAATVAPSVASATPVTPGCQPLDIPAADALGHATKLFIGASGNPAYNDNFAGVITKFSITPIPPPAV